MIRRRVPRRDFRGGKGIGTRSCYDYIGVKLNQVLRSSWQVAGGLGKSADDVEVESVHCAAFRAHEQSNALADVKSQRDRHAAANDHAKAILLGQMPAFGQCDECA